MLKSNGQRSLVYLYGPDTYAAREKITELAGDASVRWLDPEHLRDTSLAESLGSQGGLFGTTLTVLRDPSALPKAEQEKLADLATSGAAAGVLWDRQAPDKRSRLFKALKKQAHCCDTPPRAELARWLGALAKQQNVTLDSNAAYVLLERLGPNRWRLATELARLALINSHLTKQLVEQESADRTPAEIFATLEHIAAGHARQALLNLETLLRDGASEFYLLAMVTYQFRTLLLVRAGIEEQLTDHELARRAKLHPFVISKSKPLAQRFSRAELVDILTRITATDVAIKQGKADARTALLMLITNLVQQKSPQSARPVRQ